jgi:hypothetical protein
MFRICMTFTSTHISLYKRGMLCGKHRVDVDGVKRIDMLICGRGLSFQRVQQRPEPLLSLHVFYEGNIRLHLFSLAHGQFIFRGKLGSNCDGVERIDDDSLQVVFRELCHSSLLLRRNTVSTLMYCGSIARESRKKGNGKSTPSPLRL